ncbi:MAG: type II toxin-antitoxin system HicB family antitoxin [Syntrophorhabdales bacterium]|jgi:predicted RNase H-like HicB family nuclease
MAHKVSIVIEKDEHGYHAYSPELEGCQTQGDSLEETIENAREAVALYLGSGISKNPALSGSRI